VTRAWPQRVGVVTRHRRPDRMGSLTGAE